MVKRFTQRQAVQKTSFSIPLWRIDYICITPCKHIPCCDCQAWPWHAFYSLYPRMTWPQHWYLQQKKRQKYASYQLKKAQARPYRIDAVIAQLPPRKLPQDGCAINWKKASHAVDVHVGKASLKPLTLTHNFTINLVPAGCVPVDHSPIPK